MSFGTMKSNYERLYKSHLQNMSIQGMKIVNNKKTYTKKEKKVFFCPISHDWK